jgi:cell division protein FtsZ
MVKDGAINADFTEVRAVMRDMGKAMMGTGEASGDKRALRSAEAAICNPLIDDVSMRGARGLLISITGGKDLTLYEVDEAATRIREEVDADANIIVGATFDESLDGIIRVSVVATGVYINAAALARASEPQVQPVTAAATPPSRPPVAAPLPRTQAAAEAKTADRHESRITELAQRLKADSARLAERGDRIEPQGGRPSMPPAAAASIPPAMPQAASHGPAHPLQRSALDQAATAAVAAALLPGRGEEGPTRAAPPRQNPYADPERDLPAADPAPMPKAFIPPQPERPAARPPRMPSYEEFPVPGQNEFRARRGETIEADHPERRRLTLLQRLAAVGLGRRENEEDVKPQGRPAEPARAPERQAQRQPSPQPPRPAPRGGDSRGAEPVSEYGKRSTPHGLDAHGRAAPIHPSSEDDQLDIPAFLRRQAN